MDPLRPGRRGGVFLRAAMACAVGVVCLGWDAPAALQGAPTVGGACLAAGPRPIFAGHGFPLDGTPQPTTMTTVDAFPGLPDFDQPVFLTAAPDGTNRLFVAERHGTLRVFQNATGVSTVKTFLDISDRVSSPSEEEGLLGLAFDPDYATNGFFYVNYIAAAPLCGGAGRCTRVSRFTVSSDPDFASPATETVLLTFEQPFNNHNGGMLLFGSDRMLYVSTGDGGSQGDPSGNSQSLTSLLGKILRIDPTGGVPYAIPAGNPFRGNTNGWRQEIWSYGLRNPWRMSFDPATSWLWVGDVGQSSWEEIDIVTEAGENFGWNSCEGNGHDYGARTCSAIASTPPVLDYFHDGAGGFSVTGGYVYRGSRLPTLFGAYVFADYVTGNVWAFAGTPKVKIATLGGISSFGVDRDGELFMAVLPTGRLHRLEPAAAPGGQGFPAKLSLTGLFSNTAALTAAPGLIPFLVNSPLWSDTARKRRWIGLPGTERIAFDPAGNWDFPVGTVLVKHFELQTGPATTRRLETRVELRQNERWIAYTYRWNEAQTDADLLTTAQQATYTVDLGAGPTQQAWNYPGPEDCMSCHTSGEGRVLGVRTRQLNLDWICVGDGPVVENQLGAWNALGLFSQDVGSPAAYEAYPDPSDTTKLQGRRARAYLAANCAMCHQPLGPAPGSLDFRWSTPLAETNVVNVPVTEGTLGLPNPLRLAPGDKSRSMIWQRLGSTVPTDRMPKLSLLPDPAGLALIGAWIDANPTLDADGDGVTDDMDNCKAKPNALQNDPDRDDVGNVCDVCRYEPNPNQKDRGGVGPTSGPDGIGDACQCGDVNGDGRVTLADRTVIQRSLLNPPTAFLARPGNCDVGGSTDCTLTDSTLIGRALLNPPTFFIDPSRCPAAKP
jgi:uncharacterized repeat protein (TIGR03806 family)